ncbi:lipopolysaccharide biosynthesis protein [Exiguobacterium aurantiacum]|uniref:lipopolysaccharide biosynthesis protein n=1 Tax=Exiguobacterium aurantiacum TaxID=33987 RepID=UPI003D03A3AC
MKNNHLVRKISMLLSSTILGQIFIFATLPLVTRIYSSEEYGLLSVYSATLMFFSFCGTLNYDLAIPIEENKMKAHSLVKLSVILLLFSNFLLLILLFFVADPLLKLLNSESLINQYYLIPLGLTSLGLYSVYSQWRLRELDYKTIAKTKLVQSVSQNLFALAFGLVISSGASLILSKILSQSMGIRTLINKYKQDELVRIKKNETTIKEYKTILIRYKDFAFYTTPRRYLGDLTMAAPIFLIAYLYNPQIVGWFGLANSVTQVPGNIISSAVSQVFYAESAKLKNGNVSEIQQNSKKMLFLLISLGLILYLPLLLWGEEIFSFVFGEEWKSAGVYASLLFWALYARMIFKPISNIFEIFEKQFLALMLNVFRFLSIIAIYFIAIFLNLDPEGIILIYSITMALIYFLQFLLAQKILKMKIKSGDNAE